MVLRNTKKAVQFAEQCRPLVILLCVAFCFITIILIMAGIAAPDAPATPFGTKASSANAWIIIFTSLLTAITTLLFIFAGCNVNKLSMWLALPYFCFHSGLLLYCLITLILLGTNPSMSCAPTGMATLEAFGCRIMYQDGAYAVFSSIISIALLSFTVVPVFNFINECRLIRSDILEEEERTRPPTATPSKVAPAPSKASSEDDKPPPPKPKPVAPPPPPPPPPPPNQVPPVQPDNKMKIENENKV